MSHVSRRFRSRGGTLVQVTPQAPAAQWIERLPRAGGRGFESCRGATSPGPRRHPRRGLLVRIAARNPRPRQGAEAVSARPSPPDRALDGLFSWSGGRGGDVGHDGVDVEVDHPAHHPAGLVHRPHVDLQVGMRAGDKTSGDHGDAAVALGDLDGVSPLASPAQRSATAGRQHSLRSISPGTSLTPSGSSPGAPGGAGRPAAGERRRRRKRTVEARRRARHLQGGLDDVESP